MWVHGKRKCSDIPSDVQLNARPFQLEGSFVLPLYEQDQLRKAQFSASAARRRRDSWRDKAQAGGEFPDVPAFPQIGIHSCMRGGEPELLSAMSTPLQPFCVDR